MRMVVQDTATLLGSMHYFWMFLVWMVYSILAIGVLEAYSERETQSVRGARTAIMVGALIAITLSVVILWFGPVGSW
jgi:hypothetical protein